MHKPGDRVGAVSHGENGTIYLLGYGVYEGDFVPDENAAGPFSEMAREVGLKNPRIKLDSGKVIWGAECWWGSEAAVKAEVAKFGTVVMVDIDEERKKAKV